MVNTVQVNSDIPSDGYLRLQQVLHIIPVGRSTWWAGVRSGRFPASIKLGPRTTAWRAADIRQLLMDIDGGNLK